MLSLNAHTGAVVALTFSPDSQYLATSGKDGMIRLWEPPFERFAVSVGGTGTVLSSMIFTPKGDQLIGGTDRGAIQFRDLSGTILREIPGGRDSTSITGLRFMPGSPLLIVATGRKAMKVIGGIHYVPMVERASTPIPIRDGSGIWSIDDHPAKRFLAWSNGNREIRIKNMLSPDDPLLFRPGVDVPSIAISPEGTHLAAAADWAVRIYDIAKKTERFKLTGHKGTVSSVAYLPNGRAILSGSGDKTVKMWDSATGRDIVTLTFPMGRVTCLAVAPDGLRAAVGDDQGNITLWDLDS